VSYVISELKEMTGIKVPTSKGKNYSVIM